MLPVRVCVLQAHDIFTVEKGELGRVVDVQHRIETADGPQFNKYWTHAVCGATRDHPDGE